MIVKKWYFPKQLTWLQKWWQIQYDSILSYGWNCDKILKNRPKKLFCAPTNAKQENEPNDVYNRHTVSTKTDHNCQHHKGDFNAEFVKSIVKEVLD